jgi:outer membrane protein, multidrug efflux system
LFAVLFGDIYFQAGLIIVVGLAAKNTILMLFVGLAAAGCSAGPSYRPEAVVPASTRVGTAESSPGARRFFDSLAAARAADTATGNAAPLQSRELLPDSLLNLEWPDIFRDSTMLGLVRKALAQNRDVQTAISRIREFRADVGIARAPLFPSLTGNGSVSTNQVALGSFPPTQYDAFRLTADVAWELDFWGRIRRGIEAARADLGSEEAARRSVVLSLVSDVATGYLSLLELDQEQALAERTLISRQATLELARRRFQQGLTSELDVRQFEAQVAVPAATLAQTERLRAQQEHQLSLLLGEPPAPVARRGTLTQALSTLSVPDSLPAGLLARRPDVQQAERAYAAATARIGVAQAERLPAISISGYYGSQAPKTQNLFTNNGEIYQALAGISLPLFTGGRLVNQTAAARARADQARLQYEQSFLIALREASDALVGVRTSRDQVAAQQTQAQALRRALQLAEIRYRSGIASYIEVLEAQRSLFDAELALSQAQLGQLASAVELYRALGGSWPAASPVRR